MSDDRERCTACQEPEPDDNDGWMEAPSGRAYCPGCFEHLFRGRLAPKVAAQMLASTAGHGAGEDGDPRADLVDAAVAVARHSTCSKSKRGVAIVAIRGSSTGIVAASNSPPPPYECDGSPRCAQHCRRLAVHAEQRALLRFPDRYYAGAELLHVKVNDDGLPVPSGDPSCYECSKLILDAGIARVWLLRVPGWRAYTAVQFHALSLEHHGLPRIGSGTAL